MFLEKCYALSKLPHVLEKYWRRYTKWRCVLEKNVIIWQYFLEPPQLVTRNKVAYSQEYIFTFIYNTNWKMSMSIYHQNKLGKYLQNRPILMQKFSHQEGEVMMHAHIIFLIPPPDFPDHWWWLVWSLLTFYSQITVKNYIFSPKSKILGQIATLNQIYQFENLFYCVTQFWWSSWQKEILKYIIWPLARTIGILTVTKLGTGLIDPGSQTQCTRLD